MATSARQDLADSAGVDFSGALDTIKELRELHPKHLASSMLADDDKPRPRPSGERPLVDPDAT
jgi:hypothetical protein